ncbi:hypothetical protein [Brevibacillus sp. H7]|uniref:hypothetical protein n=1 Tax=Brevibacillus sp. H7 TaxID=3349138 RepID=UPI00382367E5
MKIRVYYDYFEDKLAPIWYVTSFRKGELPWDREKVYISIDAPFERIGMEDFLSDAQGLSVTMAELTQHVDNPRKLGIYLPPLRRSAVEAGYDYWDTEHLIIQVADIEEVLQMQDFGDG